MTRGPHGATHTLRGEWLIGVASGAVAVASLSLGLAYGKVTRSSAHEKVVAWSCAAALLVAGVYAVRHLAAAIGRTMVREANLSAAATLRLVATGLGYVVLLLALFGVLGVSLTHLLIGFGLTGVIIGIAAQQSLANVFASVVLLIARPFLVGDRIHLRSGVLGTLDVEVLGIGLTYVTVSTGEGVLKIPNAVMLASGIEHAKLAGPPPPDSAGGGHCA